MEKVAGAFGERLVGFTFRFLTASLGPENALTTEDSEALSFVLPASDPFDTAFFFYLHASKLFKMASLVQHEVSFTQLALSVAPLDADTSSLWNTVIKGYTDLSLYDDAHSSLIATPYEKQSVLAIFRVAILNLPIVESANAWGSWCIACARTTPSKSSYRSTSLASTMKWRRRWRSRLGMLIHASSQVILASCILGTHSEGITATVTTFNLH
jgi:hypothetical protein